MTTAIMMDKDLDAGRARRDYWACRDTVGDRGEDGVEELWTRNGWMK